MERSLKALKEKCSPLTKVFLEVEILSHEKTLDHKGNPTKLKEKEIKDKQEKLKQEKLNQSFLERYYDKTKRKTIKKNAHKKDSKILTKLLTLKLFL